MSHFLKTDSPCVEKNATTLGINVRLPNGCIITSTHTALLDLPALPLAARQAHLFPDLCNSALLSISQFCDHGFEARFNSKTVRIMRDNTVILQASREPLHWPLAILPTTQHLAAHSSTDLFLASALAMAFFTPCSSILTQSYGKSIRQFWLIFA
jgi:hypothetical protein